MESGRLNHWEKWIALPFPFTQVIRPKLKISSCQFQYEFQYSLPAIMMSHFLRSLLAVKVEIIQVAYEWDLNFMAQHHLELVIGQHVFCNPEMLFHSFWFEWKSSWITGTANNGAIHVVPSTVISPCVSRCQVLFYQPYLETWVRKIEHCPRGYSSGLTAWLLLQETRSVFLEVFFFSC